MVLSYYPIIVLKKKTIPNPKSSTLPIFIPFPLAELLSACHELRCRYGCVMTRNGTFCFCADGFEVGEDGTSCRGKTPKRRRPLPLSIFLLSHACPPIRLSLRWKSGRCVVREAICCQARGPPFTASRSRPRHNNRRRAI